jgi:uncharacterized protein (UPF0276 family)
VGISELSRQPLGVGMPLLKTVPRELYARRELVQFVELAPEMLCRERRDAGGHSFHLEPAELLSAKSCAGELPLVVHGTELSIGSAHGYNRAYPAVLDELQRQWPFVWHSEHLGFQTYLDSQGRVTETGVPLPLPPTPDAIELVASRVVGLWRGYDVPFLLENTAHYLPGLYPQASTEGQFLGEICQAAGCWLLLDLHNLYCNATNFGFDPREVVDAMPLERVIEVHVAGGSECEGFWTDAHDGAVPEPVWELLDYVAPRLPSWRGLVFEVLGPVAARLPLSLLTNELERANAAWRRFQPRGEEALHRAS